MKFTAVLLMMGIAAGAAAADVDYTVGIINLDNVSTGLNAYAISHKGVTLLPGSPYVLNLNEGGYTYNAQAVMLNTSHTFAFVEYTSTALPYIVGFSITPNGLVYQWQILASDAGNNLLVSMSAGPDYLIAYSNPSGPWAQIINQEGQLVTSQTSELGGVQLTAISVAADGLQFYACHSAAQGQPTTAVKIWKLPPGTFAGTAPQPITPKLMLKSTDPTLVQALCD